MQRKGGVPQPPPHNFRRLLLDQLTHFRFSADILPLLRSDIGAAVKP
jgi:hypothetical protein